jgi:NAD(P)-dependent dehydrogenase (short-subunit alcohol dehydrogenase family)
MSKLLLVTGGASGIGAATCKLAAQAGYAVAINYVRDPKPAEKLATEINAKAIIKADISKPTDINRMFAETEKHGILFGLVNNAGITGQSSRLDAATNETIIATIATNLTGTIIASREAVKRMSTRYGGMGGVIVNVSSGAATIGSPSDFVWYAATKGGMDTFTMGLGKEVAEEGIRVVGIAPGLTDTAIHANSTGEPARATRMAPLIPMQRAASAEEVAQTIMFALSDAASYITATTIRVAGGR